MRQVVCIRDNRGVDTPASARSVLQSGAGTDATAVIDITGDESAVVGLSSSAISSSSSSNSSGIGDGGDYGSSGNGRRDSMVGEIKTMETVGGRGEEETEPPPFKILKRKRPGGGEVEVKLYGRWQTETFEVCV